MKQDRPGPAFFIPLGAREILIQIAFFGKNNR